ncbi:MAG: cystathionine gamma-synthase [Acidobacteria bacterium]|nr:cystathionine gamma-synthase [Acidobacteriota bacterium]
MKFSTRAIHVGQEPDPTTGSTIPPVHLSTTYTQSAPGQHKGYEYSRTQNPTRKALEQCLASLEEGEDCAAFASGLAATAAIFQAMEPGDGVVGGHDLYGGTFRLLEKVFHRWGLEVRFAADSSLEAHDRAITSLSRPRLLWLETPTNPLLDIVDISALAQLAKTRAMTVVVDNTFATPYLQKPLSLGADLVVHSTTKYLGGHSDVVGGAVVARQKEVMEGIRFLQNAAGAVPGPMDSYLVLRGLKTLAVRMERHCDNARRLAEILTKTRGVARVFYPGLSEHSGFQVARKQMSDFGGMISIQLEGDAERAHRFCSRLKVFSLAESLGGVESLCCHPATMTHASIPRELRETRGVTDTLVRLSVGIEDVEDLIADIEQAL